jgi:hypothetical protein
MPRPENDLPKTPAPVVNKPTTPAPTQAAYRPGDAPPSASNYYGAKTQTVTVDGKTYTAINPGTGKPPAATTVGMESPSSGLAITGTERNMAEEADALRLGYTKEYIASRGGINSQGYWNDTPLNGQLTAAEQKSVTLADGTIDTAAMWNILNTKQGGAMGSWNGGNPTGGAAGTTSSAVSPLGTSGKAILIAKLQQLQIPEKIINSSVSFIEALMKDGISQDEAVDLYYNNKDFTTKNGTKLASPFYAEFTFLREFAPKTGSAPTPLELMQFKLGVQNLVSQYKRSPLFSGDDSLKKYIGNNIDLVTLYRRFTEAAIKETEANPLYVQALQKMGYISGSEGIGDFYLDNEIGQKQFELNKQTGAFAQQALAQASRGVKFDAARITQLAAPFAGAGTAAQAGAEGYETIGLQLNPLTKLEGIYNRNNPLSGTSIQTQLEEEQFRGTASELRKRRIEQEQLAFQGQSGTIAASRLTGGSLGTTASLNQI